MTVTYDDLMQEAMTHESVILETSMVRGVGKDAGDPLIVVQRSDGSLWEAIYGREAEPYSLLSHRLALADVIRERLWTRNLDVQALSDHIAHLEALEIVSAAEQWVERDRLERLERLRAERESVDHQASRKEYGL